MTNFVTYYFPLQLEVHVGISWQQRYYFPTALCSSMTSIEGGEGGTKSRWDCYVEVLVILACWCLGKDAVRSLHKQFSIPVLVDPVELTWQTNTWSATGHDPEFNLHSESQLLSPIFILIFPVLSCARSTKHYLLQYSVSTQCNSDSPCCSLHCAMRLPSTWSYSEQSC